MSPTRHIFITGHTTISNMILGFLGIDTFSVPRFRNIRVGENWNKEERGFIVVRTRTGGSNREDYADGVAKLQALPWYSHDRDADYDITYCKFYYKIPEPMKPLAALADMFFLEGRVPVADARDAIAALYAMDPTDADVVRAKTALAPVAVELASIDVVEKE